MQIAKKIAYFVSILIVFNSAIYLKSFINVLIYIKRPLWPYNKLIISDTLYLYKL